MLSYQIGDTYHSRIHLNTHFLIQQEVLLLGVGLYLSSLSNHLITVDGLRVSMMLGAKLAGVIQGKQVRDEGLNKM